MIVEGIDFGPYTIAWEDWDFIKAICDKYDYKSVLEFGCGMSTVLFAKHGLKVYSAETDQACADKVLQLNMPNIHVILHAIGRAWEAVLQDDLDLVFVDGPFVSKERRPNIEFAGKMSDAKGVVLHDSHEPWILEYGAEFLAAKGYTEVMFGGSKYQAEPPGAAPFENRYRCSFWRKP